MRRWSPVFVLLLLSFLACQSSEEEKIHHTLVQREEAFRKKDLSLYLSSISKAYADKDEDFEQLKNRISRYFELFDKIEYRSWERSVQVTGRRASVTQEFVLEVEMGGKRKRYAGREILSLEKEGGEWKIIKGL